MSLKSRTAAARKDQESRRSGLPKLKPDTYTTMLNGVKFGPSKNSGKDMFTLSFQVIKGEETGKEFRQEKFNMFFSVSQGWAMDIIYSLLEDMGAELDYFDPEADPSLTKDGDTDWATIYGRICEALEAAIGTKGFVVYCMRKKDDEKKNQYYLNDSPEIQGCLADEDDFGINEYKAPKKSKGKKKSKPEPEPEETEEEDTAPAETDDDEFEDWDED